MSHNYYSFEAELRTSVNGITELTFDLEKLDYISSAGLSVLLEAQKVVNLPPLRP